MIDNQPWWVAKDVCDVLDIKNHKDAINRLDEDEVALTDLMDSIGRQQGTNIINEPGLYSLVLSSRKQIAKEFKRWITHEVIPSIRKSGSYSVQQPALPQSYKEALVALIEKVEENEK